MARFVLQSVVLIFLVSGISAFIPFGKNRPCAEDFTYEPTCCNIFGYITKADNACLCKNIYRGKVVTASACAKTEAVSARTTSRFNPFGERKCADGYEYKPTCCDIHGYNMMADNECVCQEIYRGKVATASACVKPEAAPARAMSRFNPFGERKCADGYEYKPTCCDIHGYNMMADNECVCQEIYRGKVATASACVKPETAASRLLATVRPTTRSGCSCAGEYMSVCCDYSFFSPGMREVVDECECGCSGGMRTASDECTIAMWR